jgi:iron complex transport system substrate-binding protein
LRQIFCETLGTKLALPGRLERVVSFSPAVTETLFQLGAGDSVVGVSAFCARPPEARKKRVLGSYNTVDRKILEGVKPDLIFTTTGYQREFALRLGKDFPVYAVELPVSLAGIVDMVGKVGLITDNITEATSLFRNLLNTLCETKPLSMRLKVYLEIDFGGPVSFGAYSYITDTLRYLGAESIYGNQPCEWLTPDLEYVKQADPDAIVYEAKMYSRFEQSQLTNLFQARAWSDSRAVRNEHVFLAPGPLDFFAHHGPSFITTALPWLRNLIASV